MKVTVLRVGVQREDKLKERREEEGGAGQRELKRPLKGYVEGRLPTI